MRIAASLSAILLKPIHVFNIRAGREKPGLRPQHLVGLMLVKAISNAKMRGGRIGSTEIWLWPDRLVGGGEVTFRTGTAG